MEVLVEAMVCGVGVPACWCVVVRVDGLAKWCGCAGLLVCGGSGRAECRLGAQALLQGLVPVPVVRACAGAGAALWTKLVQTKAASLSLKAVGGPLAVDPN